MAFGNRQMIAGKKRGKEQEGRKMSAGVLFYLPKHGLERACTLCALCLVLGREKWRNLLEKMNHFNF